MKALIALLAIFALGIRAAPAVPVDPAPDGIGVYFDQGATVNCLDSLAPYTFLTGYLLVTNPSRPAGISAWEAAVLVYPTSFPAGITFDVGFEVINPLVPPYFQVDLPVARTGNPILLMTISTFYLGGGDVLFGIGPCVPSSFGGLCAGYADGSEPSVLVGLTPSLDGPWTLPAYAPGGPASAPPGSFIVARASNGGFQCPFDGAIGTRTLTWGSLKALYE